MAIGSERMVGKTREIENRDIRYCTEENLEEALSLGWFPFVDFDNFRREYCCMVVWLCDCPPKWIKDDG